MRIACIALWCAVLAQAQDLPLWGGLEQGPHAVGFRSSIALDQSRKYDGRRGRPVLLDVWYPAVTTSEPGIAYGRYLQVPDVSGIPWFRGRLESFIRDAVSDDLFHEKTEAALQPEERTAWERLLRTHTKAHLEAAPAEGRFPVVIYHAGAAGSFEDNSVLFEYLASHGYVVVSSAFQSQYPKFIGNNVGGIEQTRPDLDFIAAQAVKWPYADARRMAAMGHSAGAWKVLYWVGSPKCPARALVSLDTTLEYTAEDFAGHKAVREALRKRTPPRIPVLLFARAGGKPRFGTWDGYLREAPRYEAEVAGVNHDDFVTHGYLGRALRETPEADTVRRSYEAVCRTVRTFLDAWLKGDAEAKQAMESAQSAPVTIRYRPAQ